MFESTQLNPAAARELGRRYKLGRRLGFGGMAEVYEVEHRDLGTQHALKVLRIASPSMQNRLLQEGRMQAGLRHPNVVVVSDVIRLPGDVPALIMDLIVGPPLDLALKNFRPTVDQIDALGRGILRGIGAAHAHGLIHRDVKPENVLLSVERGGLVPKIADFGLAKVFESDGLGTRTGMAMGTPRHMAPEQFRDAKAVDHRADLYSVGTLLYSLASGCHAFVENDFIAVYTKATKGEFIPLREQVPDLPERMYRAVEASIVAELGDRVQSAAELLDLWTDGTPDPVDVFSNALCERLVALSPMGRDPGISSSNTNLMESRQSSDTGVTELVEPLGGQAESQSDLETEAVDRRSVHTAITISEEPATLDLTVTQQPAPEMARPRQGLGGVGVVLLLVAGIILGALGLNMIQTHNLTPTPPVEPVPVVVTPAPDVPVLHHGSEAKARSACHLDCHSCPDVPFRGFQCVCPHGIAGRGVQLRRSYPWRKEPRIPLGGGLA